MHHSHRAPLYKHCTYGPHPTSPRRLASPKMKTTKYCWRGIYSCNYFIQILWIVYCMVCLVCMVWYSVKRGYRGAGSGLAYTRVAVGHEGGLHSRWGFSHCMFDISHKVGQYTHKTGRHDDRWYNTIQCNTMQDNIIQDKTRQTSKSSKCSFRMWNVVVLLIV